MLRGDVFTKDVISMWLECKRDRELNQVRLRPVPYEYFLYSTPERLCRRTNAEVPRRGASASAASLAEDSASYRATVEAGRTQLVPSWGVSQYSVEAEELLL